LSTHHGDPRLAFILGLAILCVAGSHIPNKSVAASPSSSPSVQTGDWLQPGRNPRKTAFNPNETTIDSSNVSQLILQWKASYRSFDYGANAVVANGFVYGGHDYGMSVYPLDCGTGGVECDPVWETDENAQRGPVVIGDLVLSAGGSIVNAYPALGCGQSLCDPVMTLGPIGNFAWTITGAGDVVVVTTQTYSWAQTGLYVFDLSQCSDDPCEPAWTAKIGPHESGSVAVARGSIYVGGDKNMFVFDLAGCGAEVCSAAWVGLTGAVGHADTTPTVADGFVYLLAAAVPPNTRSLSAFPANGCGHSMCKPTWAADVGTVSAGDRLAVAYQSVFVIEDGQMAVFNTRGCGRQLCEPEWIGEASGLTHYPPPTVASDVVYTVAGGSTINAFATSCDSDICEPVAALSMHLGVANEVFVSNGKLVASTSGGIEVFGLP
jgi:hypothetical protein